jgi:hypothetical protein
MQNETCMCILLRLQLGVVIVCSTCTNVAEPAQIPLKCQQENGESSQHHSLESRFLSHSGNGCISALCLCMCPVYIEAL